MNLYTTKRLRFYLKNLLQTIKQLLKPITPMDCKKIPNYS